MTTYGPFPAHEICASWPMLNDTALDRMAESIADVGQQEQCLVWGGQLVDGRNRWRACERAGVEPSYKVLECSEAEMIVIVFTLNMERRHLTTSQWAMIAADFEPKFAEDARKRQREHGGTAPGRRARHLPSRDGKCSDDADKTDPRGTHESTAAAEAGAVVGVSATSVERAKRVTTKGIPSLAKAVRDGDVSVAAAARVASLPKKKQEEVMSGGAAAVRAEAKKVMKKSVAARAKVNSAKYSIAKQMVEISISQLKRIPATDPKRKEQLTRLINWIKKELEGKHV